MLVRNMSDSKHASREEKYLSNEMHNEYRGKINE